MYVRPRARQIGIARRLAEGVIEHARSRVELLQLSVVSENAAARRLYTSLGFEEYGIDRRGAKYQGRYHDDVLMVKMLVLDSATGPAAQSRGDDP
jgi:ribosomal protein S18 acetylase RimI-like enzyme